MRGLIDIKGEQFAYLQANTLYTLDGEPTGHLEHNFIVDLSGRRIWRVIGDGVYALDGIKAIGYLTANRIED
jgi:hypothetical protein